MVFTSMKESSEQKTILFFWTEKYVSANWNEGLLEKCVREWKKMVSTSQKISFHQQEQVLS